MCTIKIFKFQIVHKIEITVLSFHEIFFPIWHCNRYQKISNNDITDQVGTRFWQHFFILLHQFAFYIERTIFLINCIAFFSFSTSKTQFKNFVPLCAVAMFFSFNDDETFFIIKIASVGVRVFLGNHALICYVLSSPYWKSIFVIDFLIF